MLNYRQLQALPEWEAIEKFLSESFQEAARQALSEDKDIGVVRYCKGRIDMINEFKAALEQMFPEEGKAEESNDPNEDESILLSRPPGEIY